MDDATGTDLLERDAELAVLDAALRRAAAGSGSVVLISGEAGIGKTSVVRHFVRTAEREVTARGALLQGACDDLLTPRTLGPLRDAVRGRGGPLERALAEGDRDAILVATLTELAAARPTVLVVEDVHWADDATLDVLRYVGRRIDEVPAVVVATFRGEEVGRPLRRVLGALGGPSVHRMALGGSPGPRSPASPAAPQRPPRRCSPSRQATRSTSPRSSPPVPRARRHCPARSSTRCSRGSASSTRPSNGRWSSSRWCRRPSSSPWRGRCSATSACSRRRRSAASWP